MLFSTSTAMPLRADVFAHCEPLQEILTRMLQITFSFWTLSYFIALAGMPLLWFLGPLMEIGGWRPLEDIRIRLALCMAVLVVILFLAALRRTLARRRNARLIDAIASDGHEREWSAENRLMTDRFASMLQIIRLVELPSYRTGRLRKLLHIPIKRNRYRLPWYLLIGAPGTGKTTVLQEANLQLQMPDLQGPSAVPGIGGTRHFDYWLSKDAVLFDTAGRYTTQDSWSQFDQHGWKRLLAMILEARRRDPVKGVLVTVSALDLLAQSVETSIASIIRDRVHEIYESLQASPPITVLITKCDLIGGFVESFATLDAAQRSSPWGFTLPDNGQAILQTFLIKFDALLLRLNERLVHQLQLEPDLVRRLRIYGFPSEFANLRSSLLDLVRVAFAGDGLDVKPMLRSIYFVSATQVGMPIDRLLGAVARRYRIEPTTSAQLPANVQSYFLKQLFREAILSDGVSPKPS